MYKIYMYTSVKILHLSNLTTQSSIFLFPLSTTSISALAVNLMAYSSVKFSCTVLSLIKVTPLLSVKSSYETSLGTATGY